MLYMFSAEMSREQTLAVLRKVAPTQYTQTCTGCSLVFELSDYGRCKDLYKLKDTGIATVCCSISLRRAVPLQGLLQLCFVPFVGAG